MTKEFLSRAVQLLLSSFIFDAPVLSDLKTAILRAFFTIGNKSYVSRGAILFAPHSIENAYLRIGDRVGIEHHCDLDYSGGLEIQDDVWISEGVLIATHSHQIESTALKKSQPIHFTPLVIGADAWIGARAVILGSVGRIGRGAIIGAGSIVTRDVEDWEVVVGSPARVIRKRQPLSSTSRESECNHH